MPQESKSVSVPASLAAKFPEQAKALQARLDNHQDSIGSDLSQCASTLTSSAHQIMDAAGSLPKSAKVDEIISAAMMVIMTAENIELLARS